MSIASRCCADRRARSTDPTRSAASFRSSRAAAASRRRRRRSKPAAATCGARRARPPAKSTACAGRLGANYFEDAGFTGTARERPDRVERRCAGDAGVGIDRLAARVERHRTCRGSLQYVDTERGSPGPYRIGSRESLCRRRHGLARHDQARRRRRALDAAVVWRRQPRPPARRVRRRRLRPELQERSSARPKATRIASHARIQTDVAANAAFGFSGGLEWLGERGGSTFITAGTAGEIPVERGVLGLFGEARWNATDRATVTAGVRGERITREALPGDPLAFQPRPDFPEETINSVNPKIAASFLVGRGHAPAWLVRHRHSPARRVRDRLHRQLRPQARAQQERRVRRVAGARRAARCSSTARRSSTTTPT